MSESQVEKEQQTQTQQQNSSLSSSSSASPSNSISLIKLDELSSFGATKQSRLPTLIKLNCSENIQDQRQPNSMPAFSVDHLESSQAAACKQQQQAASLPVQSSQVADKENLNNEDQNLSEDFQMVDMTSADAPIMGPSLPQMDKQKAGEESFSMDEQRSALISSQQFNSQHPSHLGDSLIEMIVNLRNENQNLVRALETNNEYVKDRISEFKRISDEAKKREAKFALEKADQEHQVRKLQRQNMVLSERLKSMEVKLKEMKLEVGESLVMAHSSKASSIRCDEQQLVSGDKLYPNLETDGTDLFTNSALQATTMQMDATSGELYLNNEPAEAAAIESAGSSSARAEEASEAKQVGSMSKEELKKRFDAEKVAFNSIDDPMQQCDRLEQQLNDIGKRDYEICLLQQQLNIYRQDFRLERMANLEAKLQIEKLKNDIDRLCLERLNVKTSELKHSSSDEDNRATRHHLHRGSHHRASGGGGGVRFEPVAAAAGDVISKLGHQLGKKAARSAAKAAKYASKQAHREEKAAARAAHVASVSTPTAGQSEQPVAGEHLHHSRRHHHHHRHAPMRALKNEVVGDLLSTANKAMLTGYKLASTHVNLALDKLSAFEQSQANNLAANKPQQSSDKPSAPPMGLPSLD